MVSQNMYITGDLVSKNGETKDWSYYIWGSFANMDRFPPYRLLFNQQNSDRPKKTWICIAKKAGMSHGGYIYGIDIDGSYFFPECAWEIIGYKWI